MKHTKQYINYLHSPEWNNLRSVVFKLVKNKCVSCGGQCSELHHLNYDRLGREKIGKDVVPLCKKCHKKCHTKQNWCNKINRQTMTKQLQYKFAVLLKNLGRI